MQFVGFNIKTFVKINQFICFMFYEFVLFVLIYVNSSIIVNLAESYFVHRLFARCQGVATFTQLSFEGERTTNVSES